MNMLGPWFARRMQVLGMGSRKLLTTGIAKVSRAGAADRPNAVATTALRSPAVQFDCTRHHIEVSRDSPTERNDLNIVVTYCCKMSCDQNDRAITFLSIMHVVRA